MEWTLAELGTPHKLAMFQLQFSRASRVPYMACANFHTSTEQHPLRQVNMHLMLAHGVEEASPHVDEVDLEWRSTVVPNVTPRLSVMA